MVNAKPRNGTSEDGADHFRRMRFINGIEEDALQVARHVGAQRSRHAGREKREDTDQKNAGLVVAGVPVHRDRCGCAHILMSISH